MRLSAGELARLAGLRHAPTAEQTAVVESPLEPLLVVAGAGSGKTETMAARVVWLVENGLVRADEVLALTFTRKAAGELSERVMERLRAVRRRHRGGEPALGPDKPRVATYHAYAGGLVRDHGLRIGIDPEAHLLSEAGRWQLAAKVVESWAGELPAAPALSTVVTAVLDLAGEVSEHLLAPDEAAAGLHSIAAALEAKAEAPAGAHRARPRADVRRTIDSLRTRAELLVLVEAFGRRKTELGLLDFADQVALACRIAREVPEVRRLERERYRVVLLDEYQDTSVAQVALLSALFDGAHPVTAVGDPHQAIYGWRGASAGSVERFAGTFRRRDGAPARVATLSTSWRNDKAILCAANVLAEPLRADAREPRPDRQALTLPVLGARPGAGPGRLTALVAETAQEEAEQVARLIDGMRRGSIPGSPPATTAVLCRARAQMPGVAAALRARGIPVEVVGLGGLLSTPEVADLHAALLVAHDPSRADAAMRLLTGLHLGVADLAVLHERAQDLARSAAGTAATTSGQDGADDGGDSSRARRAAGTGVPLPTDPVSIVEAIERPPGPGWADASGRRMSPTGAARVRRIGAVLRTIRSQSHLPLPELVGVAERLLGLDIEVLARPGADPRDARRHLDELAEVAADFSDGSPETSLGAFLAWLEVAAERERGLDTVEVDVEPHAVQVLTVHAAKGLEWDVVAVVGLADGTFPSYDGKVQDAPASSAWLTALGALPYPLRADSEDLPLLDVEGPQDHAAMAEEWAAFRARAGHHLLREERRLMYVAVTRARRELVLSGSWWKDQAQQPRPPSRFLAQLRRAGALTQLVGEPDWTTPAGAENPAHERRPSASWPPAPAPERLQEAQRSIDAVTQAGERAMAPPVADASAWSPRARQWAREVELLLAERAAAPRPDRDVVLPAHLSASSVVRLVSDPAGFALERRRPVPARPTAGARRGTLFHAWVERHFGAATLLDVDDFAAADDELVGSDEGLEVLQEAFLASPWASRTPLAVEVSLETPVAGTMIRCRVDAVFATPEGVEIVDWKTGPPPRGRADAEARQVQLALYRLAWSRLHGMPLSAVSAAFYHVGEGLVVPAAPLDEEEIVTVLAARLVGGSL